jgi:DNA segregation ATPase FtsK/SpoIIIE-like protein
LEQLRDAEPDRYEEALRLLNAHREDIRERRCAVVLWLTPAVREDLLRIAPDFADWRTPDARFELSPDAVVPESELGELSLEMLGQLLRQAASIEEMLVRPALDPNIATELQKQLAQIRRQLGQIEASVAAATEAARTSLLMHDFPALSDLYRQWVIDKYSKLTLYSITSDAPLAVDLERVFVKLTATLSGSSSAGFERDILEIFGGRRLADGPGFPAELRAASESAPRTVVSVHEALQRNRQLIVVGAPGSGKTTLLRYLAVTFARHLANERLHLSEGN